jgi:LmbE family N-acetylglucosaminyl deacetylase
MAYEEKVMLKNIVVVAPHPDDETLGCGGTLFRHKDEGNSVHWLICTEMRPDQGYASTCIEQRKNEIQAVSEMYGFNSVHMLGFPTSRLDQVPIAELVEAIGCVFREIRADVVYLPYGGDAHSDHKIVFSAAASCCKVFRNPTVRRVLVYETLSETDFGLDPDSGGFRPQVFAPIDRYLEKKLAALGLFADELHEFPFPRSERAVRSLAALRGVMAGTQAAEAFMLLREIV